MNIPNEIIFAAFGVLSTVIVFLFGIYRSNIDTFKKETKRQLDDLVATVEMLRNERADLLYKIGKLEAENQSLRRRLSEFMNSDHEHDDDDEQTFL